MKRWMRRHFSWSWRSWFLGAALSEIEGPDGPMAIYCALYLGPLSFGGRVRTLRTTVYDADALRRIPLRWFGLGRVWGALRLDPTDWRLGVQRLGYPGMLGAKRVLAIHCGPLITDVIVGAA